MTDQDNETEMFWVSDRAGIGVFKEENYDPSVHYSEYTMYVDAQGKAIEFPIDERLFNMIREDFENRVDE